MSESNKQYTLSKVERISLQSRIDTLFTKGESFIAYPLRVVYSLRDQTDDNTPVCILASVSKRKFKRAVKRNRVKRLIREAYRLNKYTFWDISTKAGKSLDVAFLYLRDELPDYTEIEKAILKTSALLEEKILSIKKDEINP